MAIHDVECCEECAVHDEVVQSVRGMLPDDDDLYDLAELFKVFVIRRGSGFCLCCLSRRCVSATLHSCLI